MGTTRMIEGATSLSMSSILPPGSGSTLVIPGSVASGSCKACDHVLANRVEDRYKNDRDQVGVLSQRIHNGSAVGDNHIWVSLTSSAALRTDLLDLACIPSEGGLEQGQVNGRKASASTKASLVNPHQACNLRGEPHDLEMFNVAIESKLSTRATATIGGEKGRWVRGSEHLKPARACPDRELANTPR